MTPFSDGLADADAGISFHVFDDCAINTMNLETIGIIIFSDIFQWIFRGEQWLNTIFICGRAA
jgi:hypothetical protein